VPEKSEAGDVGASTGESGLGEGGAGGVEAGHEVSCFFFKLFGSEAAFDGGANDTGAEWFGEKKVVAGLGSSVGDGAVGVNDAGHGESVEGLGVLHGVSTGESGSSLGDFVGTTFEDEVDVIE